MKLANKVIDMHEAKKLKVKVIVNMSDKKEIPKIIKDLEKFDSEATFDVDPDDINKFYMMTTKDPKKIPSDKRISGLEFGEITR